ncbi:hypothetical protein BOX15_Mlig020183g4, partial [Macrostomum lignano]
FINQQQIQRIRMHSITDVNKPLWDQSTFWGRLRHFAWLTDPRSVFASRAKLEASRDLILACRSGAVDPRTVPEAELIRAKQLFESAYHPDSGELQNLVGRMSFQVPGGMALTGALMAFYRTTAQVVFWQWVNQSFNALVNYTNRNANSGITSQQLMIAYTSATGSAIAVSLGLKAFLAKRAPPFAQRFVPFVAVAAANLVNLPLMRQAELLQGVQVKDENGNQVGTSRYAACKGIGQVVTSRITIAAPGMLVTPFIMDRLETARWFARRRAVLDAPLQTLFIGSFLLFMVPTGCAIFPQNSSVSLQQLKRFDEPEYAKLKARGYSDGQKLYFNKGL